MLPQDGVDEYDLILNTKDCPTKWSVIRCGRELENLDMLTRLKPVYD